MVRVQKAKDAVGDKAPQRGSYADSGARGDARGGRGQGRGGILGKRGRDWQRDHDSAGSETDKSVRNIPMPRDTPPPIPFQRPRQNHHMPQHAGGSWGGSNANAIPLGEGRGGGAREPHALPDRPAEVQVQTQTIYEAKPAVRDLRKEAVSRFVPTAVQQKLNARKGDVGGRLMEEDELQKLEGEGYGVSKSLGGGDGISAKPDVSLVTNSTTLAQEEERFEREMKSIQVEDVLDEDS